MSFFSLMRHTAKAIVRTVRPANRNALRVVAWLDVDDPLSIESADRLVSISSTTNLSQNLRHELLAGAFQIPSVELAEKCCGVWRLPSD